MELFTAPIGQEQVLAYAIAVLALFGCYWLYSDRRDLKAALSDRETSVARLSMEVDSCRERIRSMEEKLSGEVKGEMKKATDALEASQKSTDVKGDYWDKISWDNDPKKSELNALADERDDLQRYIERAKTKYHSRAIDDKTFSHITEDYQKKLIEVEAKMEKIQSRKDET
jgi:hypothetical protein